MAKQRGPACSSDFWIRLATVISVVLLAVIAAVVSFGHMRELALRHGEARWSATLIPLSVDGMVVAASMSVLLASKMGRRGEWLPWALLIVGSLASLSANVAVANPDDSQSPDRRVVVFRVRRGLPSASKPVPHRPGRPDRAERGTGNRFSGSLAG